VSAEAVQRLSAAFTLGDAEGLRSLIAGAGFRDIHIRIRMKMVRQPSLEDFVLRYLSATPMAGAVAALDDAARTAMLRHLRASLRSYVDDDGLAAPWESHVVTAQS
jgi:hypothetical protein